MGNSKLREKGLKTIAYKGIRFADEGKIFHSRINRKVSILLSALDEIDIIEKIEPSIEQLSKMKAAEALKTTIHITVKSRIKELNQKIQSNLLGAK